MITVTMRQRDYNDIFSNYCGGGLLLYNAYVDRQGILA